MNNLLKNIGIWLVIGLVVLTVVKQFDSRQGTRDSVSYSEFMDKAKAGRVESASVEGRKILWTSTGNDKKRNVDLQPGRHLDGRRPHEERRARSRPSPRRSRRSS